MNIHFFGQILKHANDPIRIIEKYQPRSNVSRTECRRTKESFVPKSDQMMKKQAEIETKRKAVVRRLAKMIFHRVMKFREGPFRSLTFKMLMVL